MDLFEQQAKSLLTLFRIPFPPFFCIDSPKNIEALLKKIEFEKSVLLQEFLCEGIMTKHKEILPSKEALRQSLQASLEAHPPHDTKREVSISPVVDVETEFALAVTLEMSSGEVIVSVAKAQEKKSVPILQHNRLYPFQKQILFSHLGLAFRLRDHFFSLLDKVVDLFFRTDSIKIECNPMAVEYTGQLLVLGILMTIDDSSLYRQKELQDFYEKNRSEQLAWEHEKKELFCQEKNGTIAVITNGRELLHATCDLLHLHKKEASLAIDIGDQVDNTKVEEAVELALHYPDVHSVLVNLFCGLQEPLLSIQALIKAMREDKKRLPVVLRVEAASTKNMRDLLATEHLPLHIVDDWKEAVARAAIVEK